MINWSGREKSLPHLHEDKDSSRWGQRMDCEGPAVLHGKCKDSSLKNNFGTTWMGCLLSMVGEDTVLQRDPTPACSDWVAWDDQHHGPLPGMVS